MGKIMSLEKMLGTAVNKIFVSPYNWTLIVLTIFLFTFIFYFGYWSTGNFDLITTSLSFLLVVCVGCLISDKNNAISILAILSIVLTLIFNKTMIHFFNTISIVFDLLSMFLVLLTLKQQVSKIED